MAEAWQTIEEAALTLGISTRTLHRRISKDEFQTRLNGGRREVLVRLPEIPMPSGLSDRVANGSASSDSASGYGSGVSQGSMSDTGEVRASVLSDGGADTSRSAVQAKVTSAMHGDEEEAETMLALTEDRLRRTDLAIFAYQQSVSTVTAEARRIRTSARIAWSATGVLATVLLVVSLWATHRLTASQAQVVSTQENIDKLKQDVTQLADVADSREKELEAIRKQAQEAQVAAAEAQGALQATKVYAQQSAAEAATWRAMVAGPVTQPVEGAQPASYVSGGGSGPATQPTTPEGKIIQALTTQPTNSEPSGH